MQIATLVIFAVELTRLVRVEQQKTHAKSKTNKNASCATSLYCRGMRATQTARFHQMHPSPSGYVFRAREEGPCNQKARPDETVYQPSAADAVRGSADGWIAVDRHADAGRVLTVCLFRGARGPHP
jgi:hypothetical protein